MRYIQTVSGPVSVNELGLILAHEHLFTDLRGPDSPDYARADPEDVRRVMQPYLDEAWNAGVTALAECSTGGVGLNPAVLKKLAEGSRIAIVAPTGVYRHGFIPKQIQDMDEETLTQWMTTHLTQGIDGTWVRAGFIKMGVSNEAITPTEARNLRCAARAALQTDVLVASHTSGPQSGQHALEELDILESQGLPGNRFNWVHAQHADLSYHRRAAERGAYIGFDGLSPQQEERYVKLVLDALDAGLEEHILLSHDAGWYRPGEPNGGQIRGFTYLTHAFLPRLRREGVTEDLIKMMTETNPKRAFAVSHA